MLDFFLPPLTPALVHPLFGSIVGLLEFFLFLIQSFDLVVFGNNSLRGAIQLASKVQDRSC